MRAASYIFGIIPGIGQMIRGRYLLGLLYLFIFFNALNGYFVGSYLWERPGASAIKWISLAAAVVIWVLSFATLFTSGRDKTDPGDKKETNNVTELEPDGKEKKKQEET